MDVNDRVLDYQEKLTAAFSYLPGCLVTAPGAARVPGTVHVTFEGLASDEILFLLDQAGVCASAAASCSSGASPRVTCSRPWASRPSAPEDPFDSPWEARRPTTTSRR